MKSIIKLNKVKGNGINKNQKDIEKDDFLKDISIVVGGKNAGMVIDILINKKNVNEFLIAKKLNFTINQIRNILYKLADEGLVSFVRKKDKKKGWYTYFWTFNEEKSFSLIKKVLEKDIQQLEHQLKSREIKQFYTCKTCNSEITEENALLHSFACPECGEIYESYDNTKIINEINLTINKLRKRLERIEIELKLIEGKKIKRLEGERKKIEKEKIQQRKLSALNRKKQVRPSVIKIIKKIKKKPIKRIIKKIKKKPKKNSRK